MLKIVNDALDRGETPCLEIYGRDNYITIPYTFPNRITLLGFRNKTTGALRLPNILPTAVADRSEGYVGYIIEDGVITGMYKSKTEWYRTTKDLKDTSLDDFVSSFSDFYPEVVDAVKKSFEAVFDEMMININWILDHKDENLRRYILDVKDSRIRAYLFEWFKTKDFKMLTRENGSAYIKTNNKTNWKSAMNEYSK